MHDLNDLGYFAAVAAHGGYVAAERALGIPKSRLSRRVAALEQSLGVRLIQRSTRRFAVTPVGLQVLQHAQSMRAEAEAAVEAAARSSAEPRGAVRVSCPVALAQQQMAQLLPRFLHEHPKVQVHLHVSNRRVDVIGEGFDVALRVRSKLDTDGSLAMRSFGPSHELLVASPAYLRDHGRPNHPDELAAHAILSSRDDDAPQRWELVHANGERVSVDMTPRVAAKDFVLLSELARQGLGIALLPALVCGEALAKGELQRALPQWDLPQGICHAVFPSRRGMLPAVRAFIDFLAAELPPLLAQAQQRCCVMEATQPDSAR